MATNVLKTPPKATLDRIKAIVGAKGFVDDPAAMAPYLREDRGLYDGRAALVVRPQATDEVAGVVEACAETGIAIVPQGGNTSLCGAGVPHEHGGEIVLSLSRMTRVRDVDALNYTITVESGCILANVQHAAEAADRLFPLSLAAEGTCQIGGNLSTNAGGISVLRYGMARDLVLGLEVVLPDGRVWNGLRSLRKDNTGYDLKQLFIGAEGTPGIITAAVLKLFAAPRTRATALVAVADVAAAVTLLGELKQALGDRLVGFELISAFALALSRKHGPRLPDPLPGHPWYALVEAHDSAADAPLAAM